MRMRIHVHVYCSANMVYPLLFYIYTVLLSRIISTTINRNGEILFTICEE